MSRITHFKAAALKAGVVLVPSYLAAYMTDKMVWVVPTLAASSFFAASIGLKEEQIRRRVDEDEGEGDDVDHVGVEISALPSDGV